jgi:hypothetical protein
MPDILALIRPDALMGQGDVRPAIIEAVKMIAAFKLEPPSVVRDKHAAVVKAAKHLRLAIRGMLEYAALDALLERVVKDSEQTADAAAPHGKLKRSGGDQESPQRNLLAAALARNILLDHALNVPSLTDNSTYIRLTALLVKVATNRPCSIATAGNVCRLHFKQLVDRFDWPYVERGRRPREPAAELSPEHSCLVAEDAERLHRERVEEVRRQPPLERLLDEMF